MSKFGLTYAELKALNPCAEKFSVVTKILGDENKWNGKKISVAQALKAGVSFSEVLWAVSAVARKDKDADLRLRLWIADCAAHTLHFFEEKYPSDMRPRKAIQYARDRARGLTATYAAAAYTAVAYAAAAYAAAAYAADAAAYAAYAVAYYAADAAAAADDAADARKKEREWQQGRLALWFEDKEPSDWEGWKS